MKIGNYEATILSQRNQGIAGTGVQAKRSLGQAPARQQEPQFDALLEKTAVSTAPAVVPDCPPALNQSIESMLRSLALSHLRSRVGDIVTADDVCDIDGNGTISFSDLTQLDLELSDGRYGRGVEVALQGIRTRVGQSSDSRSSGAFDLNNDGLISFADIAYFRDQLQAATSPLRAQVTSSPSLYMQEL